MTGTTSNVTERKIAEDRVEFLATRDPLTRRSRDEAIHFAWGDIKARVPMASDERHRSGERRNNLRRLMAKRSGWCVGVTIDNPGDGTITRDEGGACRRGESNPPQPRKVTHLEVPGLYVKHLQLLVLSELPAPALLV